MNVKNSDIFHHLKARFPFFEDELMQKISEIGILETIEINQKIIEPGRYVKYFPLLCQGIVEVFRDDADAHEILLYFLKPGEACSAMLSCCMTNLKSEIHAKTIEESIIIKIPISYIDEWLHTYPTWKTFIFNLYRLRFNELLNTIDSLAFLKMDERLIRFFKTIYESSSKTIYEGSHSDIAQSLNSSREVISRLLKTLENQGKVVLYRNKIDFTNLM
jgi:CRP/FNR family transcriptional regulator